MNFEFERIVRIVIARSGTYPTREIRSFARIFTEVNAVVQFRWIILDLDVRWMDRSRSGHTLPASCPDRKPAPDFCPVQAVAEQSVALDHLLRSHWLTLDRESKAATLSGWIECPDVNTKFNHGTERRPVRADHNGMVWSLALLVSWLGERAVWICCTSYAPGPAKTFARDWFALKSPTGSLLGRFLAKSICSIG